MYITYVDTIVMPHFNTIIRAHQLSNYSMYVMVTCLGLHDSLLLLAFLLVNCSK